MNQPPERSSSLDPMITALLRPEAYDHDVERIELMETHISWILLGGGFAYKIKKPVNLGFVDFSTADLRRHFCTEELRLNQRLAPELYLDLVNVRGPVEQARFHGDGETIEVALRMRRFPQEALLPAVLARDGLPVDGLDRLAEDLATFHGTVAVAGEADSFGSPEHILQPAMANIAVLRDCGVAADLIARLHAWTLVEHARLEPVFLERKASGHIRECHGDLHLGNMVLLGDRIVVFDCLEFNPSLRWIDVISDMAFLVMDLQVRGAPRQALRVLDRWLRLSGDYTGLHSWRWYLLYRGLVRAKVTALRIAQCDRSDPQLGSLERQQAAYLDHARAVLAGSRPALVITHGVSGSGKSHLARLLCDRLGWIQVGSDVERRRLFGRWGTPPAVTLRGDPYSDEVTDHLYGDRLHRCAESALSAGLSVILDATFLRRRHRDRARQLADRRSCPFLILDCRVSDALARRRIAGRLQEGVDPSEADGKVLAMQRHRIEPLSEEETPFSIVFDADVEPGRQLEALVRRITRAVGEAVNGDGPAPSGSP